MTHRPHVPLADIFRTFFIIGATGFGGGMAIISVTEQYCVHRRKWLSHEEFMHGLAFGQILGPFSLNSCTFVGCYLRGTLGGIVAATGFLMPSFFLISALSWLYFKYHQLPQLQSALKGTNPVVIALILVAAAGMRKTSIKGGMSWFVALAAFIAAAFFRINALTILLVAGCWAVLHGIYLRENT
jgi:chromate transporter